MGAAAGSVGVASIVRNIQESEYCCEDTTRLSERVLMTPMLLLPEPRTFVVKTKNESSLSLFPKKTPCAQGAASLGARD